MDDVAEGEKLLMLARSGAVLVVVCALALALVFALGGCGTPCPEAAMCKAYSPGQTRQPVGHDVVCFKEPQTGSHITETRCYTRTEVEERRKADHDMLERTQMQSNRPGKQKVQ